MELQHGMSASLTPRHVLVARIELVNVMRMVRVDEVVVNLTALVMCLNARSGSCDLPGHQAMSVIR